MIRLSGAGLDAPAASGGAALLDRLDLEIHSNEYVVICGPNGAGKSLFLQLAARLKAPSRGEITFDNPDMSTALVFQRPDDQIVGSTVRRDLAFGLENHGVEPAVIRERVEEALAWSGLADLGDRPPHLLSEGQKQRLALTAALVTRPALLLLDEPTSRLDPEGRRQFRDAVSHARHDLGATVVQVTHRSEEVLPADRVIGLVRGTVRFDGTPDELLRSEEADSLGILWTGLHRFQRELMRQGHAGRAAGEWNDPRPFLGSAAGGPGA